MSNPPTMKNKAGLERGELVTNRTHLELCQLTEQVKRPSCYLLDHCYNDQKYIWEMSASIGWSMSRKQKLPLKKKMIRKDNDSLWWRQGTVRTGSVFFFVCFFVFCFFWWSDFVFRDKFLVCMFFCFFFWNFTPKLISQQLMNPLRVC